MKSGKDPEKEMQDVFAACETIHKYECDKQLPAEQCLTTYLAEFNMVIPKHGVTNEQLLKKAEHIDAEISKNRSVPILNPKQNAHGR